MTSANRRNRISEILKNSGEKAISASALATMLGVSRQVIVGDIALLRAAGEDITATPRGYVSAQHQDGYIGRVACVHDEVAMQDELYSIVDNGGEILDVIVEHPIYGQITAPLQIRSRFEVDEFVDKVRTNKAQPLSLLTDGVHLHTISCANSRVYDRIVSELHKKGYLFEI